MANSATRLASSPCRPSSRPLTFFPGGIERKAWERGYYQAIFNYLKGNIPRRVYQGRERISMQQQEEGSNNCGLYSIAAVYHATKRDRIAILQRSHLMRIECGPILSTALNIKNSQLSPSPGKLVKQVDLNCSTFASQCTVPVSGQTRSFDEMIQCDKCDTWYHFKCAKVKEDHWFCSSCRQVK